MEQKKIDIAIAINGIKDPQSVRFMLYHNGNLSHASMKTIFSNIEKRLEGLEQKLKKMEGKN